MTRLLGSDPALVGDKEVTVVPINLEEDFEEGDCALAHREKLRQAALANPTPLLCLHCRKAVSSNLGHFVEQTRGEITVGFSHSDCLAPADRVLGLPYSRLFEETPELVNFDPNAWFRASHGGQLAFHLVETLKGGPKMILWGGRRHKAAPGDYVVEMLLRGGEREFVTVRNGIDRFEKTQAEAFAAQMNEWIEAQKDTDFLCISDETKLFGTRDSVLEQVGAKEKLIVIESARVRRYEQRFAARYETPGSWYAPLLYFRSEETGELYALNGLIVLITTPFALRNFVDNWKSTGLSLDRFETISILDDRSFDDFMIWLEGRDVIVDPMLKPNDPTTFIGGTQIKSIDEVKKYNA
jgi:hypothetical protein